MKIGINASFLRKLDTGIGQVSHGFVKEIIRSHSDENEYFLYLEKDIELKLPKNFHKRIFLPTWKRDDLIRKIWWEKLLLPKKVRGDKCDVFISLYQCPTNFAKNIKHKMLVHDLIPKIFPEYLDNWRKKLYFYLSNRAIRRTDEIFTISEWSKKDIHKYLEIPTEKIKVAHPSVGEEFFEKADDEKDNRVLEKYGVYGRYIFYVGGFDFRKNIPGLLKAYAKLLERYEINDVNLVLGGEDKSRFSPLFTDVRKEIKDLELEENVKLIGFVEQKDMPALYRQCELFVLSSFYEGFGLMALEAMACGAPTAVSKSSSLPEVGGDAVLYFNPHDTEEMARVMGKILRNNKLRLRLAEKGRERAKKFSWKSFVKVFLRNKLGNNMPAPEISIEKAKKDKLFYFVANVVVWRESDRRCLILKRSEREKVHPGKYAMPGGKLEWKDMDLAHPTRMNGDVIDFENAVEDLVARETREEAGIEIEKKLYYINSVAFVRPDGIPVILVKFAAKYKSGNVSPNPHDFSDFAWVNENEIVNYDYIKGIDEEIKETIKIFGK